MRFCRTTQLDVKHEEAEGGEQTMPAPWNEHANMPLHLAALVRSNKSFLSYTNLRTCWILIHVWNLLLHI